MSEYVTHVREKRSFAERFEVDPKEQVSSPYED